MDTLQAAVLLAKLDVFEDEIERRQRVADTYSRGLGEAVQTPIVPAGRRSAWAQYSVLTDRREKVMARLKEERIPAAVYYPKPLHLQRAFSGLGHKPGDFPVAEDLSRRIFSLPMHPYLELSEQERVIAVVRGAAGS